MYYKYDLKNGIIYDCKIFLLPFIISIVACLSFTFEIYNFDSVCQMDRKICFSDVFLFVFKGELPFDPNNPESFRFPFIWVVNQLLISFIIGKYPFSEIYNNHGAYVLIKGKSRKRWIISKFIWAITVCIIYYIIIILTLIIYSVISNYVLEFQLISTNSPVLLSPIHEPNMFDLLGIYLLPLTTSIAISFLQISFSLILNSIFSFGIILGIYGVSIFYESLFGLGNCSLMIRNEYFMQSGIPTRKSYLVLLIVMIISFMTSIKVFEKCDILQNRRNE